jgi:PAS domain S-box-containing protein
MGSDSSNRLLETFPRWMRGLRGRLIGLFLLLALMPMAITAVVSFRNGRTALEEHIGLQLSAQADHISESVDHLIIGGQTSLENWAQLSVMYDLISDDADGRITGALITLARDQSLLDSLIAVSLAGKVLAASEPNQIGKSVAEQDWFMQSARGNPVPTKVHGRLTPDLAGGHRLVTPIFGGNKSRPLLGYLSAYLPREKLAARVHRPLAASVDFYTGQDLVFIVERTGAIQELSNSQPGGPPDRDFFPFDQIPMLRKSGIDRPSSPRKWIILTGVNGREYLAGLTDPQIESRAGKIVVVARPLDEAHQPIYELRSQILGIGLGLAVLAAGLAIIIGTRLGRPIGQLTKSADAVASGDFAPNTLPVNRQDEIGSLARAFDRMREDLFVLTQDLEQRVQARTAELRHVNQSLQIQITERERAEESARASEERFVQMVSQVKDYTLVMLDPNGLVVHWNNGAERMNGYAAEDILGQHFSCFYPVEGKQSGMPAGLLTHAVEQGSVEDESWRVKKNGANFWAHVTITSVRDDTGQLIGFSMLTRDLTAQKESEQDKALLQGQLQQAQKMEAVGRLAGGIAHDFNNLLTVIGGYTHLIQMEMKPTNPLYPAIEEIAKSAERAAGLTQQLLAFSRKQMLQPTHLSLNEVLLNLERMLRPLIGEDIRLETVLSEELDWVKADRGQVDQVVMNLAVNARDAMPKGGRLILRTGNVVITHEHREPTGIVPPGRYVSLEVRDTGCGMDDAIKKQVFEPFFTTKEPGKGTGLGLATVYGIAKQSGGFITVESEIGQGAAFTLYLPAIQPKIPAESKAESPHLTTPAIRQENATILLVEDESGIRRLLHELLTSQGYKVLTAPDGDAGFTVGSFYSGRIDMLITDVVMPKLSGAEMAKRLTEKHPRLKVLYMSGYTDESIVQHGVLEPGIAFLSKPFKPEALIERVRKILAAA